MVLSRIVTGALALSVAPLSCWSPGEALSAEPTRAVAVVDSSWQRQQSADPTTSLPDVSLDAVLDRLSRVAGLYRDQALSFACRESITNTRYGAGGRVEDHEGHEFEYIYVFNDPDDPVEPELGAGLVDYRTDPRPDDDTELRHVDLAELGLNAYLLRPYSWAFLFQPGRQRLYDFELAGDDRVDGRPAWIVSFTPKGLGERVSQEWVGRVWVDQESTQLLRVEAARLRDLEAAERAREESRRNPGEHTSYLVLSVATEFDVVENGMRFPSVARLEGRVMERSAPDAVSMMQGFSERGTRFREAMAFEVRQQYEDYEFFSVRTEEEIRELVRSGRRKTTDAR